MQKYGQESIFPLMWRGFPGGSDSKESAHNAGDPGSIPESERSPEEGNGNTLQYSSLGNPMNRGAWQASGHEVATVRHDLATKPPPISIYEAQHF